MTNELQPLIHAITNLRPQENPIKDYIYPIILAFLSAIMGGFIGYLGILRREYQEIEKAKIDATSEIVLEATDCIHDLMGMKDNYRNQLTPHPLQRLTVIRPILMEHSAIKPDITGLLFIARCSEKAVRDNLVPDDKRAFLNIARIKLLFVNFNTLFEMWKTRNKVVMPLFDEIISRTSATAVSMVDLPTVISIVGQRRLAQAIDLNEKIISSTDELIEEFVKLINELPEISEVFISDKALKKYGHVIRGRTNEIDAQFFDKVPVDKELLEQILS